MARGDKNEIETELPDASDRYLSKPLPEPVPIKKVQSRAGRVTPVESGKSIRRTGKGTGFGAGAALKGLIPERLITKPESVGAGGRPFAEEGTPGAVKFDVPFGPPRPDKQPSFTPGIQKHMAILGAGAPALTEAATEIPQRIAIGPRPAEVATDKKEETIPGQFSRISGGGGGVGVAPSRETAEPERMGRFIDPTQTYTVGAGGIGKQDVVGGQNYLDLQKQKEKITGSLAYRFPTSSKASAREQAKLDNISKQQLAIRTGIETSIRGGVEATTKRGEALSSADAVRDALEEKQRTRVAQQEQFDVEEERLGQVAEAQIGVGKAKTAAIFAGEQPVFDPLSRETPAEFAARGNLWKDRYRSALGAGAPAATEKKDTFGDFLNKG